MINHLRTLLLNRDGDPSGYRPGPGEEFVPPGFRRVALPAWLGAVRAVFFGPDPDRLLLNWRLRQLTGLLHATELGGFVTALDPRVTYRAPLPGPVPDDDPLWLAAFRPRIAPLGGTSGALYLVGALGPAEETGRAAHAWRVEVLSGPAVRVDRRTPPGGRFEQDLVVEGGLSGVVPLQGAALGCRVDPSPGSAWLVEAASRPGRDPGAVLAGLDRRRPLVERLLGVQSPRGRTEPWATFRGLWSGRDELPYRLGALVLALAYCTDSVRRGSPL